MLRTEDYATHRVLRWLLEGGNEKEMKIKPRFGIVSMLAALVLAALPDRLQADVIRDGDWLQVGGSLRVDVSTAVPLDQKRTFTVDSGSSVKSVSVSGLPSGLKYDAARRTVSGRPTKSGVFYVTVTAYRPGMKLPSGRRTRADIRIRSFRNGMSTTVPTATSMTSTFP